jgi:hypothetical protein
VQHKELGRDGIASLTSQVDANEVVWDVALIPTEDALPLAQRTYLTAIDYNVVDRTLLYPELCFQHAVGARLYSTIIVYSAAEPTAPAGWPEFWDLGKVRWHPGAAPQSHRHP